jgi:hypothetical protein
MTPPRHEAWAITYPVMLAVVSSIGRPDIVAQNRSLFDSTAAQGILPHLDIREIKSRVNNE